MNRFRFLLASLITALSVSAQTVQIGSGTDENRQSNTSLVSNEMQETRLDRIKAFIFKNDGKLLTTQQLDSIFASPENLLIIQEHESEIKNALKYNEGLYSCDMKTKIYAVKAKFIGLEDDSYKRLQQVYNKPVALSKSDIATINSLYINATKILSIMVTKSGQIRRFNSLTSTEKSQVRNLSKEYKGKQLPIVSESSPLYSKYETVLAGGSWTNL